MLTAIILAAGSSSRMNGANKQLAKIGDIPVFIMSAQNFQRSDRVDEIVIAAPAADAARYEKLAKNFGITKLKAVTSGGATRFLSVKNALEAVSDKADMIAIHDGARPLIDTEDIDRVIADAEKYGAAIAACAAVDTVKVVGANGFIEDTPQRSKLFYAQTPQVFKKKLYLECIEKLGAQAENLTDDSALLEQCGEYVRVTEITECNLKITRPEDLEMANAVYRSRKAVRRI